MTPLHEVRQNLGYWLSRTPEERLAAVDFLRRQIYGDTERLQRIAQVFNVHRVEYLIVGGYALAFHGAPRFTGDIDIFVKPESENAKRILAALEEFGFGSINLSQEDFITQGNVVQLGVPPVRIDIMTSLTGVSWQEAQEGKVAGNYGDTLVFFISKDDFIANKKALGRRKDLADLETLGQE